MKRKHIALVILVAGALVATSLANAVGGAKHDDFRALFEGDNWLVDGTGTGWNGGEWIKYDETDWWNQWFYDDPPSRERMKHIDYFFEVVPLLIDEDLTDFQITVEVALNWSNMEFPETGDPATNPNARPPMPEEEWAIEREIIFAEDDFAPGQAFMVEGMYDIWDYNPEWVSIDMRVYA